MNFNGSKFYRATNRTFGFSPADGGLLAAIRQIALQCWDMFDLKNYARVDRSIDKDKNTLVLEINANPCIAPDSGFLQPQSSDKRNSSTEDIFREYRRPLFQSLEIP